MRRAVIVTLLCVVVVAAKASAFDPAPPADSFPAFVSRKVARVEYPSGIPTPLPEGTVKLWADVNAQGVVESVQVVHELSPELDSAASRAVSGWHFTPAEQDGAPVPSRAVVDVVFASPHPYVVVNGIHFVNDGGATPPKALYAPDPEYTKAAVKAKITGTVVLLVAIDEEGRPKMVRIQRSLDPVLDQSSVDAVRLWKFEPSRKDGQPVLVLINVEVVFKRK